MSGAQQPTTADKRAHGREFAPTPTGGMVSKVDKFKWTQTDASGRFEMIRKFTLLVDRGDAGYQRAAREDKVAAIARAWSWMACGCLIVARRDNGELYVVDGQHRLLAALKRSDLDLLPCLVFEIDDLRLEAAGFIRVNVNRKPLSAIDRHRALIMQGDALAIKAQEFIDLTGREVRAQQSGSTIECVTSIMKCISEDAGALSRISEILITLCAGRPMHGEMIDALFHIERKMAKENASLSDKFWTSRVLSVGYDELISRGRKMREALGSGGHAATAKGYVAALSVRLRRSFPGFSGEGA